MEDILLPKKWTLVDRTLDLWTGSRDRGTVSYIRRGCQQAERWIDGRAYGTIATVAPLGRLFDKLL